MEKRSPLLSFFWAKLGQGNNGDGSVELGPATSSVREIMEMVVSNRGVSPYSG